MVGFLAQSDLLRGLYQRGEQLAVDKAMQVKVINANPGDNMEQVLDLMQGTPLALVTVSKNGQLKGIINFDNIFELLRIQSAIESNTT